MPAPAPAVRELDRSANRMTRIRQIALMLLAPLLFVGCAGIGGEADLPSSEVVPAENGKRSSSLPRDLRLMWSVQPKEAGRDWVMATDEAIDASERVFNTVDLKGQSKDQIAKTLRFQLRAKNYGYYAPFWPADRRVFPIRIDNGNYGWQFDIHFDTADRVEKVMRRWIH